MPFAPKRFRHPFAGSGVHPVDDGVELRIDGVRLLHRDREQLAGRHLPRPDQRGQAEGVVATVLIDTHGV